MDTVKNICKVKMLIVCILQAATIASPAFGDVIYTYTGNNFTEFLPSPFPGPLVTSISGSFTLPSLLVSANDYNLSPLNYSFTDGVNTLTSANSSPLQFHVSTNSAGDIIGSWNIAIRSPYGTAPSGIQIGTQNFFDANHFPIDITAEIVNYGQVWGACNEFNPGSWTVVVSPPGPGPCPVPEPTTILLLGSGLLGLAGLRRKFKK
jgi:hypothetical protein